MITGRKAGEDAKSDDARTGTLVYGGVKDMARWVRYSDRGTVGFGTLDEEQLIHVHSGDIFDFAAPTGQTLPVSQVELLLPATPSKMLALWNNFHSLADKLKLQRPAHPLYLVKTSNSFLAPGGAIRRPRGYSGRIVYEGELGIVIGRRCAAIPEAEADAAIFGYTCINDVTAVDLITEDPSFAQWVRAKSFDTLARSGRRSRPDCVRRIWSSGPPSMDRSARITR